MARAGVYRAIVLDRVLPKLSGDLVLQQLRAEGNCVPIVIVTGFPDSKSGFLAGSLQAACYLEKGGITGAQLVDAVRTAITLGPASKRSGAQQNQGNRSDSSSDLFVDLRGDVNRNRGDVIRALATALLHEDLTTFQFEAVANGIRMLHVKPRLPVSVIVRRLTAFAPEGSSRRMIRRHEPPPLMPASQEQRPIGADRRTTSRFRRSMTMRRASLELLTSDEYVSQIAYALGYSEPGNFSHTFRKFFGVSPRHFRRLI